MKAKSKLSPALNLRIRELKKDSKSLPSRGLKILIKFRDELVTGKLNNIRGVKIISKMPQLVTASVPAFKISKVAAIKGVEYIDLAQALKPERGSKNG